MKKYQDYQANYQENKDSHLTDEELKKVKWTKYKIIVPTQEDKLELMNSFEHFHNEGFDSNFITVNQLAHEYLHGENIIVNKDLYDKL